MYYERRTEFLCNWNTQHWFWLWQQVQGQRGQPGTVMQFMHNFSSRWDPGLWEKGLQALRKTYLWKAGWFPTHTFQHKQYFVHLGLIVSASVVDEDCRTLCWLSSKMQAAVVRNTKEWRTWQRCSWTVCYIWTMVWMKRALEIIEALSFPVQSMKNFPEQ